MECGKFDSREIRAMIFVFCSHENREKKELIPDFCPCGAPTISEVYRTNSVTTKCLNLLHIEISDITTSIDSIQIRAFVIRAANI
uniref:Uncharacterized protein n=1 Tax=Caenorhabditis tropicalis TaxID=1561998 RepID=A0A1I7TE51_9PELO